MEEKNLHVRIVPMTADHLDEVAELERICFTTPWSRNMLAEELDNYLSAFLVALDDNGKVAGYAGLQAVLDEGYITNVAVRPDCRKQGVAGKLLQVFLDFAQANHLAFLTLEVRASNYPAIALYGSRGFRGGGVCVGGRCQRDLFHRQYLGHFQLQAILLPGKPDLFRGGVADLDGRLLRQDGHLHGHSHFFGHFFGQGLPGGLSSVRGGGLRLVFQRGGRRGETKQGTQCQRERKHSALHSLVPLS